MQGGQGPVDSVSCWPVGLYRSLSGSATGLSLATLDPVLDSRPPLCGQLANRLCWLLRAGKYAWSQKIGHFFACLGCNYGCMEGKMKHSKQSAEIRMCLLAVLLLRNVDVRQRC